MIIFPRLGLVAVEAVVGNLWDTADRIVYQVKLVNQEKHTLLHEWEVLARSGPSYQTMPQTPNELLNDFHRSDTYLPLDEYRTLMSGLEGSTISTGNVTCAGG
jgi:hypothetical protein